jgi:hypothetical protein
MNENLPKFQNEPVDRVALITERNALIDKRKAGEEIDEERLNALTEELDFYDQKDREYRG